MRVLLFVVLVVVGGCKGAGSGAAVCPAEVTRPESLGCEVFGALAGENEAAYVSVVLAAREDVEAMAGLRTHPPKPPTPEKVVARREAAADEFQAFLEELRVRGIAPVSLQLVGIDASRAGRRGEVGFAEEIVVRVRSGKQELAITIDDCVFVRGRWLVADGLKLR